MKASPNNDQTVGLVCAIAPERTAITRALGNRNHAARTVQSGIGRAAGFLATISLVEDGGHTAGVLSIGFCGGLDPALSAGTLIVPERIHTEVKGETFAADPTWHDRLLSRLSAQSPVSSQLYYCATSIVSTVEHKQKLFQDSGFVAVDMESAGVAQAAGRLGLPFAVVRVVLDEAADTLPNTAKAAMQEDGDVSLGGLVGSLSRNPRELPALARMGRKQRAARRALANACRALAPNFGLG